MKSDENEKIIPSVTNRLGQPTRIPCRIGEHMTTEQIELVCEGRQHEFKAYVDGLVKAHDQQLVAS